MTRPALWTHRNVGALKVDVVRFRVAETDASGGVQFGKKVVQRNLDRRSRHPEYAVFGFVVAVLGRGIAFALPRIDEPDGPRSAREQATHTLTQGAQGVLLGEDLYTNLRKC